MSKSILVAYNSKKHSSAEALSLIKHRLLTHLRLKTGFYMKTKLDFHLGDLKIHFFDLGTRNVDTFLKKKEYYSVLYRVGIPAERYRDASEKGISKLEEVSSITKDLHRLDFGTSIRDFFDVPEVPSSSAISSDIPEIVVFQPNVELCKVDKILILGKDFDDSIHFTSRKDALLSLQKSLKKRFEEIARLSKETLSALSAVEKELKEIIA